MSKPRALSLFAIVSFLDKRELITKVIAKVILQLVCSGAQRGQSVSVYLFSCRFRCISWPIVVLLYFFALVYFDMYSSYVMVISVLIFSDA